MKKGLSFEGRVKRLRKKMRPSIDCREEDLINRFIDKVIEEFGSQPSCLVDGVENDFHPGSFLLSDDDSREAGERLKELGFTVDYFGGNGLVLKMCVVLTKKKRTKG